MDKIIVAGIGTEVGKTVVAAILTTLLQADYWKPIQSGKEEELDTTVMKTLIDTRASQIHPAAYSLKAPLSPHHAARLEQVAIQRETIALPQSEKTLVIEMAGGVFVPITTGELSIDLFASWGGIWVVVSRHYLGSINHTLLTLEALKQRNVALLGLVFNGDRSPDSEEAILTLSKVPLLGRLGCEKTIEPNVIKRYARQWHHNCYQRLHCLKKTAPVFGTPLLKGK